MPMLGWKQPAVNTPCKLCGKKRARRSCPGIGGEICPTCCGTARENTIDCPSHCEHLQESRLRERPAPIPADQVPNSDVRLSDKFLDEHQALLMWLALALAQAMGQQKAVDTDAREALAGLIQTYRTRQSGLIYESRSPNPYAGALQDALKQAIVDLSKRLEEKTGMHTLRDADVLGALVFLQRMELQENNGRRRSRAFYDFLNGLLPARGALAELQL